MKPKLSEKERAALMALGQKPTEALDPFERHIRSEIGRLSMVIDQGQGKVDRLKEDLADSEQALTQDVGAFQATARTYLAYLGTQGQAPEPMPAMKPAPASGPQEAPGDAQAEPGADAPAPAETPVSESPGEPSGDSEPEPEPEPKPDKPE